MIHLFDLLFASKKELLKENAELQETIEKRDKLLDTYGDSLIAVNHELLKYLNHIQDADKTVANLLKIRTYPTPKN